MNKLFWALSLICLGMALPAYAQISITTNSSGGAIRTGISSTTCNAAASGAIRYKSDSTRLEYCNGTGPAWSIISHNGIGDLQDGYTNYALRNMMIGSWGAWTTLTGTNNTAMGIFAGDSLAGTASNNTALGHLALQKGSANNNTALGRLSMQNISTGGSNTAAGVSSLYTNTTGTQNIAIGQNAMTLSNGSNNVAVGMQALSAVTTGNNNIGIGYQAADNLTAESDNVAIGTGVDAPPGGPVWKKVSVGVYSTCGIRQDDKLYCWGNNTSGPLGIGSNSGDFPTPQAVDAGNSYMDVSIQNDVGGNGSACGIRTGGGLFCWGANDQNANGYTGGPFYVPTAITMGGTWKQVAIGRRNMNFYTCAIRADDTLWCWGDDSHGQIGNGSGASGTILPPYQTGTGFTWKQVSAGGWHVCAIRSDDTAWCWGNNGAGRIGNAVTGGYAWVPTAVSGGHTWKKIAAGIAHTCGIRSDDTAWCWGGDAEGDLGNGTGSGDSNVPVAVQTSGVQTWLDIDTGHDTTCGVKTDNTGWCWGYGGEGNLGNNTTSNPNHNPVQVNGGAVWKTIETDWPACGIKTDNTLQCWGENFNGAIGNGNTNQQNVPVNLSGFIPPDKRISIGDTIFIDADNKRVGINNQLPLSALHVPDGNYLQISRNNGVPAAGDCNADNLRGRMVLDYANHRVYVCNGAARAWDYFQLND